MNSRPPPSTFIALLRGINVGGKTVKMDLVRRIFEDLGLGAVRTYVQSGNVLFAARGESSRLAKKIEERLLAEVGFPVTVLLRTPTELAEVVSANPFLKEKGVDPARLHVTFLSAIPPAPGLDRLAAIVAAPDRLHHDGREIYLHCPDGYGRSKLSNNVIEKALSLRATTRNWNTITTLHRMST